MLTLDVYPAKATVSGGGQWQAARVMVDHKGRAAVFAGTRNSTTLGWAGRGSLVNLSPAGQPAAAGPWQIQTADGTTVTVERDPAAGCGCGSRLATLGEQDLRIVDFDA